MAVSTPSVHLIRRAGTASAVDAETRGFTIRLDKSTQQGGTNTGPTPVEVLLQSLGACQAIAITTFAPRFGVDLVEVSVDVDGVIDSAGLKDRPGVRPGLQDITIALHLTTDAPQENVDQLVAYTATHCPVEDTLANGTRIAPASVTIEAPRQG